MYEKVWKSMKRATYSRISNNYRVWNNRRGEKNIENEYIVLPSLNLLLTGIVHPHTHLT